jgi:hypothetical protein
MLARAAVRFHYLERFVVQLIGLNCPDSAFAEFCVRKRRVVEEEKKCGEEVIQRVIYAFPQSLSSN